MKDYLGIILALTCLFSLIYNLIEDYKLYKKCNELKNYIINNIIRFVMIILVVFYLFI